MWWPANDLLPWKHFFSEIRRSTCALLDIMEIIVESFARILLLGIIAKGYANAIRTCVITYVDARP